MNIYIYKCIPQGVSFLWNNVQWMSDTDIHTNRIILFNSCMCCCSLIYHYTFCMSLGILRGDCFKFSMVLDWSYFIWSDHSLFLASPVCFKWAGSLCQAECLLYLGLPRRGHVDHPWWLTLQIMKSGFSSLLLNRRVLRPLNFSKQQLSPSQSWSKNETVGTGGLYYRNQCIEGAQWMRILFSIS